MADEHDTGEGSHAVELAQIREIVKEEVAKALQATIPTHMDGMQASLLDSIRQEFATLKASGDVERPSRKVTYKDFVACYVMAKLLVHRERVCFLSKVRLSGVVDGSLVARFAAIQKVRHMYGGLVFMRPWVRDLRRVRLEDEGSWVRQ
ncbi:hypothetical protein E3N88_28780 [Mikania micrantha]|uniref:Uncharacterized protein n=1 Tax=Mikania micrantha TaxID=192012 RepID=A0A5N6N0G7_9ASTR|nr:hypothetical protein E3N88_28780 [Mikania micrantha]